MGWIACRHSPGMLHGGRELFRIVSPSDQARQTSKQLLARLPQNPSQFLGSDWDRGGKEAWAITGATVPHLPLGPASAPGPAPSWPLRVPTGIPQTRPGLPWGGACLPAPYGGAEGVRPPPGPAPLPPGPTKPLPPAPPSMGSDSKGERSPSAAMAAAAAATSRSVQRSSSFRRCRRSLRHRYRVSRAPAHRSLGSPRRRRPAPPRSAPGT
jgi:hypothetical protein